MMGGEVSAKEELIVEWKEDAYFSKTTTKAGSNELIFHAKTMETQSEQLILTAAHKKWCWYSSERASSVQRTIQRLLNIQVSDA